MVSGQDKENTPSEASSSNKSSSQDSKSRTKKSKRGRDVFEAVLAAKGELSIGSQLSLTQNNEEEYESLAQVVGSLRKRDLETTLELHSDDPSLADFVKSLFRGASPGDPAGLNRRVFLYQQIFDLAMRGKGNKRNSLFNFLLSEVSNLPVSVMGQLVEGALAVLTNNRAVFGDMVETWSPFEFIPALLVRVFEVPKGALDPEKRCSEDLSEVDGLTYAFRTIEEICRVDWPLGSEILIVSTLHDLSEHFSPQVTACVMEKALQQIPHIPYGQLAKMANSLFLLLTSGGPKTKIETQVECLNHLVFAIEELDKRYLPDDVSLGQTSMEEHPILYCEAAPEGFDKESFKMLLQAQGTIISSFCLVVSKAMDLGRAFIKACDALQGGVNRLSVFRAGMLMGLTRIKRLEKKVLDVFVRRARVASTRTEKSKSCTWLRMWNGRLQERGLQPDYNTLECYAAHCQGLDELFLAVQKSSKLGGWDTVVQSFTTLGMEMIDLHNKYAVNSEVSWDIRTGSLSFSNRSEFLKDILHPLQAVDPSAVVAALGVQLVATAFCDHSIVQRDLLEFVRSRLSNATAGPAESGVYQVVKLLGLLVDSVPNVFLRETSLLKDFLADLPKLPPRVAFGVLHSLKPLLRLRMDLVDFAVLVFRKALFQRDLQPRLVALNGLFLLMTCISQGDKVEQQLDIINCLHRCFTHQAQVRGALYSGFGAGLTSSEVHPSVKRVMLQALLSHLDTVLVEPLNLRVTRAKEQQQSSSSSQMELSLDDEEDQDTFTMPDPHVAREGPFPILVSERCCDRASGEIVDPVHLLVRVLVRVARHTAWNKEEEEEEEDGGESPKEYLGKPAKEALKAIGRLICLADVSDIKMNWKNDRHVELAVFCCEVLTGYKFHQQLWRTQCELMQHLIDIRCPSLAGLGNKSKTKRRKGTGEAASSPCEDDASGDGGEEDEELPLAPEGLETSFTLDELFRTLPWDKHPDALVRYWSNTYMGLVAKWRGGMKKSGGVDSNSVFGLDLGSSVTFAELSTGGVIADVGQVTCSIALALFEHMCGETTPSESVTCALKTCIQVAREGDMLESLTCRLAAFISNTISTEGSNVEDESTQQAARPAMDCVIDKLWDVVESVHEERKSTTWAPHLLGAIELLMEKASGLESFTSRSSDLVQRLRPRCGAKCADAALQVFFCSCKLASSNKHKMHGEKLLVEQLRKVVGGRKVKSDDEEDSEAGEGERKDSGDSWEMFQQKRYVVTAFLSLSHSLSHVLEQCEWVSSSIREDPIQSKSSSFDAKLKKQYDLARAARSDQEKMLYSKLNETVQICTSLLEMARVSEKCDEQVLKVMVRHYKLLGAHLRILVGLKTRQVSKHLRTLVKNTKVQTKTLYDILGSDSSKHSFSAPSQAQKEAKLVPNLIFQIEQYEVLLIKLSKLTAPFDEQEPLASYVCPSLNRDFKLKSVSSKKRSRAEDE